MDPHADSRGTTSSVQYILAKGKLTGQRQLVVKRIVQRKVQKSKKSKGKIQNQIERPEAKYTKHTEKLQGKKGKNKGTQGTKRRAD